MTDYNITVGKELLPELLSSQDGLAKLVERCIESGIGGTGVRKSGSRQA
ncbi:Uncharacterised protein [Legionella israelensis]|nr:hypothetical protein SAMN02746069_01529 [Legionella israelensis DSM 19235]SCY53036.1 hypothetical protein SAMN02746069_02768 [Legionella israelensis DSM 19235]STX57843.1 Uncharacterised protein [Legionella israelensis]